MAEGANNIPAGGGSGAVQPPSPPAPDPRLPLTPMQVFKLKKNWKGVKRRLEDTGVEMLIRGNFSFVSTEIVHLTNLFYVTQSSGFGGNSYPQSRDGLTPEKASFITDEKKRDSEK
ncbi:hypothetical protein RRG08_022246 [Elysia crispata]|uniref:Uncharacterized protein n=1 Tax=Elysia crispata TaxID=231223 RepID=A0AAE1DJZ9_9GAST|nr:hypothetical protein RRG08_022246 [Elysia crispata]